MENCLLCRDGCWKRRKLKETMVIRDFLSSRAMKMMMVR